MKRLMTVGGAVTIVVLVIYSFVITPPPAPLLDANRNVLAENYQQGYCTGTALLGGGNIASSAAHCRSDHPKMETERNLPKFWPTLNGNITNSWSKKYPYPLDRFGDQRVPDDSRTGERERLQRD
jgi:hypothetical protein